MIEYTLDQSVFGRAKQETLSAQKRSKLMWAVEVVLAIGGSACLIVIAPDGLSILEMIGRSVGGSLGGLLLAILAIFTWNLFRAPYRQRNEARALVSGEPRPSQLSNRDELISAIHQLKTSAYKYIICNTKLNYMHQMDESLIQSTIQAFTVANNNYRTASNNLECQKMIANEKFHGTVNVLITKIRDYIKEPEPLNGPLNQNYSNIISNYLDNVSDEAVNRLDELNL